MKKIPLFKPVTLTANEMQFIILAIESEFTEELSFTKGFYSNLMAKIKKSQTERI